MPTIINKKITQTNDKVRVLETNEQWYGVTYSEDLPGVKAAIAELTKKGLY